MGFTKKPDPGHSSQPLTPGDHIAGYTVKQVDPIASFDAAMIQLEHEDTGTRHIHIACPDKENTFGVIFRTVPEDDTGVAHILEHTVLCGSRKYAVKDPFFSMLKRSLSTFMNALTASDWTMYPFSTQNRKDYFNLMDVYLDAVFFPNLDIMSFKQEGHRIEIDPASPDSDIRLTYKGVVYNEMKGAMSSPSQVMGRSLLKALYPDTTYSNNSGGEPSRIPTLTHEDLKSFHERYYHPSNAFFYTYGSFDLADTLTFINDRVISGFSRLAMDTTVPPQPRWYAPRTAEYAYSFSPDEDPEKKYQACVAWLTADTRDMFDVLVLMVLEQILLGNSASPLRKALIDSDLGNALSDGTGFDPDNRDTMFVAGLKDVRKADAHQVEAIIFNALEQLVQTGIPDQLIESAIHQIEFYRKEITNTPHPFGIKLGLSICGALIHEADPAACVNIDDDLNRLKSKIQAGPFLEDKIRQYLLDNPHRVRFVLSPDQTLEERENQRVLSELLAIRDTLSEEDIRQIREDARALTHRQESEEDLSSLPTLDVTDISPDIETIHPNDIPGLTRITGYDKATSDILYFTCPGGIQSLSPTLLPLVPFFCKAFINSGTRHHDFVQMAEKMDLYTGGIMVSPFSGSFYRKDDRCHGFLSIQGKALDRNADRLFDLLEDFVCHYSLTDTDRIKQLLYQYMASMESAIIASGHIFAISLAGRRLSCATRINEVWHGINQYRYIKQLVKEIDGTGNIEALCRDLETIAGTICRKGNLVPAGIGSQAAVLLADRRFTGIEDHLGTVNGSGFELPVTLPDNAPVHEGWHINTAVSFVGQSFKTVQMPHADAPALAIISKLLRSLYLHREIREKGGAYGGFASYSYDEGIFSFGSYRDPHISRTLGVYKTACDFIMGDNYSESDVKEAILQVCSDIDKPETPGPASIKAFYRQITGLTDDMRKAFKDRLLILEKADIQQAAQTYFDIDDEQKGTAIIAGRQQLEQASRELSKQTGGLDLYPI